MQFKQLTSVAIFLAAALPGSVLATHKVGSLCKASKNFETYGCSPEGCSILQCIEEPNGDGQHYWAVSSSCKGKGLCNNGVCNGDLEKSNGC